MIVRTKQIKQMRIIEDRFALFRHRMMGAVKEFQSRHHHHQPPTI
jgi:hypothetical protein